MTWGQAPSQAQFQTQARAGGVGRGPGRGAALRLGGGTVAPLRVELLLLVRLLVRDAGLLGLLQRVAALVLLLHAVDEQGDQEGGEEGAHHPAHNHSCGKRGQRSQPEGRRSVGEERVEPGERTQGPGGWNSNPRLECGVISNSTSTECRLRPSLWPGRF